MGRDSESRNARSRSKGPRLLGILLCCAVATFGCGCSPQRSPERVTAFLQMGKTRTPAGGPLRISAANPRYFGDAAGKVVYLTGSHTWNSFQDWGSADPPPVYDYQKYLDFLVQHDHNFFRLYVWEQAAGVPWSSEHVYFTPLPYQRTGPGDALDGRPKFNLRVWNPVYFQRLRERVQRAGQRGIYVSVMLFNGWSVDGKRSAMTATLQENGLGDPWLGHPFHRDNNVNGIDGGAMGEVHTLRNKAVTDLQKAYVEKVIDTVGDLDNVLWEISNESNADSTAWEYEMIRFIHDVEAKRPKQHPVGMTAEFPGGKNFELWESPADWISPGDTADGLYATNPPAAPGGKVIVNDTDHIWGIGGNVDWVWKSFTRGMNPIFMDPYEADLAEIYPMYRQHAASPQTPGWEEIRKNLGYARSFAERTNLASMTPHAELAHTGYCLAKPGSEYVVYVPSQHGWRKRIFRILPSTWFAGSVEVDLTLATGELKYEWFRPATGATVATGSITGGGKRSFAAPVNGESLVLYIYARNRNDS